MNGEWRSHLPLRLLRLIAVPWTFCLIVGSLAPNSLKDAIGTHSHHRPYHFIVFGATAVLFLLISQTRRQEWIAVGGALGIGVVMETLQCLSDGYFEWWDLRDDALGILVAFVLFRLADRSLSANREAST
jgi:hypothetical protein